MKEKCLNDESEPHEAQRMILTPILGSDFMKEKSLHDESTIHKKISRSTLFHQLY